MSDFETSYRRWHTRLSYIKSALRIATCGLSVFSVTVINSVETSVLVLACGLFMAELIGIAEEII